MKVSLAHVHELVSSQYLNQGIPKSATLLFGSDADPQVFLRPWAVEVTDQDSPIPESLRQLRRIGRSVADEEEVGG